MTGKTATRGWTPRMVELLNTYIYIYTHDVTFKQFNPKTAFLTSLTSITPADWSICVQDKEPSWGPCETLRLFLAQHQSSLQEKPSAQSDFYHSKDVMSHTPFTFSSEPVGFFVSILFGKTRRHPYAWCCASTDASGAPTTALQLQSEGISNNF